MGIVALLLPPFTMLVGRPYPHLRTAVTLYALAVIGLFSYDAALGSGLDLDAYDGASVVGGALLSTLVVLLSLRPRVGLAMMSFVGGASYLLAQSDRPSLHAAAALLALGFLLAVNAVGIVDAYRPAPATA